VFKTNDLNQLKSSAFPTKVTRTISEFQVNNHISNEQSYVSISAFMDNTFVAGWNSYNQDGDGGGVYAKLFNSDNGNNLTQEFQMNNYTSNGQLYSVVSVLSDDTFAAAWTSSFQDGSNLGVYATIFNATTTNNITTEFQVNEYAFRESFCGSVAE
jgi:hypothetical protein